MFAGNAGDPGQHLAYTHSMKIMLFFFSYQHSPIETLGCFPYDTPAF